MRNFNPMPYIGLTIFGLFIATMIIFNI